MGLKKSRLDLIFVFAKWDTTDLQTEGVNSHTGRADGADYKEKKSWRVV